MQEFDADIRLAERLDASLLITGESGVETEDVARLVHSRSPRREAPFVTIRCGGVSAAQLESLLEQANGGSLLMVDVGEIDRPMQEELLRFLSTGAFHHAEQPPRVFDVRIFATTTRPLYERLAAAEFSSDLYYRLNVIHISIPTLRNRREEIPSLTAEILRDLSRRHKTITPRIAPAAMTLLQAYDWPGNMQELRDVLAALHASAHGATIEPNVLPPAIAGRPKAHVRTSTETDGLVAGAAPL
jgi:DNA-binding NtrC family response regulator